MKQFAIYILFLKWTTEKLKEVEKEFEEHSNLPNCAELLGGKLTMLIQPKHTALFQLQEPFLFSLTSSVWWHLFFVYIDIGLYRKNSDSPIFFVDIFIRNAG